MIDKIKTILSGIDGLEERTKNSDCGTEFRNGQNGAYELVKELIYQQFTELQESEDERIRRWLSDILDESNWRKDWPYTKQQVINYLEKQKEQKPAEWSEEDKKMLKRVLETYTCYEADIRSKDVLSDNDIEVLHECAEEKIWLKGRFKFLRPSWKPSEE